MGHMPLLDSFDRYVHTYQNRWNMCLAYGKGRLTDAEMVLLVLRDNECVDLTSSLLPFRRLHYMDGCTADSSEKIP